MEGVKLDFTEDALRAIAQHRDQARHRRARPARGDRGGDARRDVRHPLARRRDRLHHLARVHHRAARRRSSRTAASARSAARKRNAASRTAGSRIGSSTRQSPDRSESQESPPHAVVAQAASASARATAAPSDRASRDARRRDVRVPRPAAAAAAARRRGVPVHDDSAAGRAALPSINAIEKAVARDRMLFVTAQKRSEVADPSHEELYRVGTVVRVLQLFRLPDGTHARAGRGRRAACRVERFFWSSDYYTVRVALARRGPARAAPRSRR